MLEDSPSAPKGLMTSWPDHSSVSVKQNGDEEPESIVVVLVFGVKDMIVSRCCCVDFCALEENKLPV
jgi:hypothetical protein